MADFGVTEAALLLTAVGTGAEVYAASQAGKGGGPKLPVAPQPLALPNTKAVAASNDAADAQAKSAGGTILSNPRSNEVGDGANSTRKTLLGS